MDGWWIYFPDAVLAAAAAADGVCVLCARGSAEVGGVRWVIGDALRRGKCRDGGVRPPATSLIPVQRERRSSYILVPRQTWCIEFEIRFWAAAEPVCRYGG